MFIEWMSVAVSAISSLSCFERRDEYRSYGSHLETSKQEDLRKIVSDIVKPPKQKQQHPALVLLLAK